MRKLLLVVAMIMLVPGVASAGGGRNISQCQGFASGTTVSMLDSCFEGIAHFAPTDTTLTVTNDGRSPHTFTAVDGSFDSGQVEPGGTFELAIDEPGIYQVFCSLHGTATGEGMAGVLVVGDAKPQLLSAKAGGEGLTAASTEVQSPSIPTVPVESSGGPWVPLTAGLAAGLALATLITTRRSSQG